MRKPKGRFPDGRVFEIRDINAEIRYRHPEYESIAGDGVLPDGNDDRLIIFRLKSKNAGLPSFSARWDGGNRSRLVRYDLDIDLVGDPEEAKRFIRGELGYAGHHAIQIGTENKYNVYLTIPVVGLIFDATISFSKHHALLETAPVGNNLAVTAAKKRACICQKLTAGIMRLYQLACAPSRLSARLRASWPAGHQRN
jgi:hypothetical protein